VSASDNPLLTRVSENLETVTRLEHAAGQHRNRAERIADAIARTVATTSFLCAVIAVFLVWIFANSGIVPGLPPFDPFPFNLLCLLVSAGSVLLASLVLIKQNRMSYLSDRRAHLDLQVNLLAEDEITRTLRLVHRLAQHFGIPDEDLREVGDLTAETEIETLVAAVDSKLPRDEAP
jgi:uncharacterized membrane protein